MSVYFVKFVDINIHCYPKIKHVWFILMLKMVMMLSNKEESGWNKLVLVQGGCQCL